MLEFKYGVNKLNNKIYLFKFEKYKKKAFNNLNIKIKLIE